ncbi:MAG: ABC transporter ATP-binding protein/permease [Acidimicrobiia bacterium]|nr:ABC transporter ATP-binding protein/permease [Acidimicrobiia bacterium]NNL71214.1 ABC transporter ATP-binding protein [Acidimicrobiia bacterium]
MTRPGAFATVRRGLSLSPELRRGLPGTLAIALVATAGRVIVPVAIQQVIDGGFESGAVDMGFVFQMATVALVAVFVTAGATGWMHLRLARVAETALSGLRVRAFRHIHDLSMLHQASEQRGVLVSRVTSDVDQISQFMQWAGLMLIINGGQALLAIAVMFVLSVPLALVVVALVPLVVVMIRWFQRRLEVAYLAVRERVGRMLALLAETVVGAPVIRAYGIETRTRVRLRDTIEDHRVTAVKAGRLSATFSGVAELFSALVVAAVLVVGAILVARGSVTVGTVVAFLFLVQLFIQPIQILGEAVNQAQTAVAGWRRVLDILDIAPDVADPGPAGVDLPRRAVGVSFEGVTFRYPRPGEVAAQASGTAALKEVTVEIAARERVAVVGETGSGKTTFAKLLTRLMDATEGCIRVGGVDVRTVRFESLRDRVVMVPQEGVLFRGTIADNIRMGKPEATPSEIAAACEQLGLTDWLRELPTGLGTQVGERGGALSVGERQLVTLARAAIADPDLLVLDEATSAVDPAMEVRINRALTRLTSGRTVVTIAHRLSTAEAADRVLVFDQGRIVQDGTHRELVEDGGIYGRLYSSWQQGTSVV